MKFTMFVTDYMIQFNLEPETDTEREYLGLLEKYTGEVTIHKGVSISECAGGYLRNYGERNNPPRQTAITIHKPKTNESQ